MITASADAGEIHPSTFVAVKLYVPETNPEMVTDEPDPVIDPGLIVQFNSGKPVNITLPVASVQDGWMIVPVIGAFIILASSAMVTLVEKIQPLASLTLILCDPKVSPLYNLVLVKAEVSTE